MKSTEILQNVDKILDRIKEAKKMGTDAHLATFLEVAPGTISAWRSRKSIDLPLILAKCREYNANWIVFGEGPVKPESSPTSNMTMEIEMPYDPAAVHLSGPERARHEYERLKKSRAGKIVYEEDLKTMRNDLLNFIDWVASRRLYIEGADEDEHVTDEQLWLEYQMLKNRIKEKAIAL